MKETNEPRNYDAVLGGESAKNLLIKRIESCTHSDERVELIELALQKGLNDIIEQFGTQYCVAPCILGDGKYACCKFEAMPVEGYQSLYWVAREVDVRTFKTYQEAYSAAQELANNKFPVFWEVGDLCRAKQGFQFPNTEPHSRWKQAQIYPINQEGRRIKFAGKSHFTKLKIKLAQEPDRIGMTPVFRKKDVSSPMELWIAGEEPRPDESKLEEVKLLLEKAVSKGLIIDYYIGSYDNNQGHWVDVTYGGLRFKTDITDEGVDLGWTKQVHLNIEMCFYFLQGCFAGFETFSIPIFDDFMAASQHYRQEKKKNA